MMILALALLSGAAWFMAIVAGSFFLSAFDDTLKAKVWYVCSIIACQFVTFFAYTVGKFT